MKNRIIISLFLLAAFCAVPVFAQQNSSSDGECLMYVKADFIGSPVSFEFIETDIRNVLNQITEKFGCKFVIDKSIGFVSVTASAKNVPWNRFLCSILESQDLGIKADGETFRIAEIKTLKDEANTRIISCPLQENPEPIYTEIIRLKNLPFCPNNTKCEQILDAFKRLEKIVSRRLSRRGAIEFDEKTQTLIVTDIRDNLDNIKRVVEIIDTEDFYIKTDEDK